MSEIDIPVVAEETVKDGSLSDISGEGAWVVRALDVRNNRHLVKLDTDFVIQVIFPQDRDIQGEAVSEVFDPAGGFDSKTEARQAVSAVAEEIVIHKPRYPEVVDY